MRFALRAGALGFALALLAAGLPVAVEGRPGPPGSELPPPATGGITKLDPLLQKLTNNRTELVVFITPEVVANESDYRRVIQDLRRKMEQLDDVFPQKTVPQAAVTP